MPILFRILYTCAEKLLSEMNLDKFMVKNTSEDNVSFGEVMKEAEKKYRQKHDWLYEKVAEQLEVRNLDFRNGLRKFVV